MQQRTNEWYAHRKGKVTASRVKDVLGTPTARRRYLLQVIAERLGMELDDFQTVAMRRGLALEPEARMAYEMVTGYTVTEVGFLDHPELSGFGASPDGLVDLDGEPLGTIEIKCLGAENHLAVRLSGEPQKEHVAQLQAVMACSGAAWCDYVAYHPQDPEPVRPIRVARDDAFIAAMRVAVEAFLAEAQKIIETGELK